MKKKRNLCLLALVIGLAFLMQNCQEEEIIIPTGADLQIASKTINKGKSFEIKDFNFEIALLNSGINVTDHLVLKSDVKEITSLNVNDYGIEDLSGIEYFDNLELLECDNNQLTSLDVSKNKALQLLFCTSNQLTSLDVSKNKELVMLFCGNNRLASLTLGNNPNLSWLSCSFNKLRSLNVAKNVELGVIECQDNQLESLDVSNNKILTWLGCYNNQLTSLDVSQTVNLEYLGCFNNPLLSCIQVNQDQIDYKIASWNSGLPIDAYKLNCD